MDSDLAELQADTAAAGACVAALASLDASLTERVGSGSVSGVARPFRAGPEDFELLEGRVDPPIAGGCQRGRGRGRRGRRHPILRLRRRFRRLPGEIGSREDVLRTLDKIAAYYTRHEPSSPIPLFIERCKKLVTMSFIDIVKELVPDAAQQVGVLTGHRSE